MDDPLESLRQLAQDIKSQPEFALSHKQIEQYLERIALAAHTPDGYESLCWEVGVWLLLLSADRQNVLFNAYGYDAVRAALSNALESGCLPKGLGWYTAGFTPGDVDGDVMLGVLSHPSVQPALNKSLASYELNLDLDYLNPSDHELGRATVLFVAHLHRLGLDRQVQLMWAARLVEHLSPENPARELAIQLVLEGLLQTERYVNALYWLQAHFEDKAGEHLQDAVFSVVSAVIALARELGGEGYTIVNGLACDDDFLLLLYSSKRAQVLLALALLWLLFMKGFAAKQDFIDTSADLLWVDFPNIALFMKRVSKWSFQLSVQSPLAAAAAGVDYLQSPLRKAQAVTEARQELDRPPTYRGRAPLVELWREQRDRVFIPTLAALEDATDHKPLRTIKRDIEALSPESLIRDSLVYRSMARRRGDEAGWHKTLGAHFQRMIDQLAHITDLCWQSIEAARFVTQLESELRWIDLEGEYTHLLEQWSSLADEATLYLSPVLDEWVAARSADH
ncbi:MAG: hypothetical protein JW850_01365 [Thermoflexales bacterium]|nr:hypothetical protein [Thermoflexales bacterium]